MQKSNLCLSILLLAYICNQWSRYSIVYLGSVSTPDCGSDNQADACFFEEGKKEVPLCPSYECHSFIQECERCQACYKEHDAAHSNLQYGTCLTSAQYGVLNSFGYAITFSLCNLVAGRAADLYNRKLIVSVAAICWAVASFAQGLSHDFAQLLLVRMFMGAAQAFSTPASYSLIADLFAVERRASANGIFSLGVYVGGGLSSLSLILSKSLGWRETSFVIGTCSLLVGLLAAFTEEPRYKKVDADSQITSESEERLLSSANDEESYLATNAGGNELDTPEPVSTKKASLREAASLVFSDVCVSLIFVAAAIRFFGGFAIASFLPIFFKRQFPNDNSLYGTLNALVITFGGAISASLGGWLTDRYSKVYSERMKVWIPAAGFILGFAPFVVVLYSENFYIAILALFFEYIFAECWFGPVIALMQNRIPSEARGITIAVFLFIASMVCAFMKTIFLC